MLMIAHVTHSTAVAANIYSNPNVMISWQTKEGKRMVIDDFRDAYSWMRHNVPRKSVVMAWWDYGYQLKQMANCTIMTDNNTSNYEQIALTAMIFASEEKQAHKMLTQLNVQYVMVVYGGVAKYSMDDINKFMWMVKIAASVFPQVQRARFLGNRGKELRKQTLLYKLCYQGLHGMSEFDNVRQTKIDPKPIQLKYFTEVFTSDLCLVRIYRVNSTQSDAHAKDST